MGDEVLDVVATVMTSPWLYAVIVGLAVVDGLLPLVPSEAAVLLAGTYAALDGPNVWLVVVAAAAGALLGDLGSYAAGRGLGGAVLSRAGPGTRAAPLVAGVVRSVEARGGQLLVALRFLPGGRTAMTFTLGASRFPARRFLAYDAVACVLWAGWSTGLGYVGGRFFSEEPLVGAAVGMVLAVAFVGVLELGRRRRLSGRLAEPAA